MAGVGLNAVDDISADVRSENDNGTLNFGNGTMAAANILLTPVPGEDGEGEVNAPKGAANPKVAEAISVGNEAHADFSKKGNTKGWAVTPRLTDPLTGKTVIPDAVTPSGHPVELKPSTPSGVARGERQLPKYERATGNNGRVIYYDPDAWLKKD
jgi:hypothetical protein